MLDYDATLRARLIALVSTVFGPRIYCGRYLPAGYKPTDGAALLFAVRGGTQDYSSHVFEPSYQFRVYAESENQVRAAERALYDALNDTKAGEILYARMEPGTFPQLMTEPGSDWICSLAFYKVYFRN